MTVSTTTGIEIPCELIVTIPGTQKGSELLQRYSELFGKVYEEPGEDIALGNFTNVVTTVDNTSSKPQETSHDSRDESSA